MLANIHFDCQFRFIYYNPFYACLKNNSKQLYLITNRASNNIWVLKPDSFFWGLEAAEWDEPHADQIFVFVQEEYAL